MPKAKHTNSTIAAIDISANEALFLRCVLQCQNDYGIKPPPELGLPRSIGLVVDYDYVKRLMLRRCFATIPKKASRFAANKPIWR